MTYYQIEAFLAVARIQNLSDAADFLHVTQSTISHRLNRLEDEVGVTLIDRQKGRRQTSLTPMGERFIPIAEQWRDLWNETKEIEKQAQLSILNVVGPNSVLLFELKPLMIKICLNEPQLTMFISSNHSLQVSELLENGIADVGFVTVPIWNKNLILQPILEEPFKLVYHDPLGKMPSKVHPTELDSSKELRHAWGVLFQQWHDYWWPTGQQQYRAMFDDQLLLKYFLSSGNFWTMLPEGIAEIIAQEPGNRILELTHPPENRTIYFAKNKCPKQKSLDNISIFEKYLNEFLPTTRYYIK
jgi:DNA-binding transcriptional LysR family regulator